MHAYAANDPVFLAMNARGQRETNGELGTFCVDCHAPMAVEDGLTDDGLNLPDLPESARGVTCYFCHQVEAVEGEHNNPLRLAGDGRMRGALSRPKKTSAHGHVRSALHDRDRPESSALCGSCHDVVTPADVFLERTFAEWKSSLYARPEAGLQQTCGTCHMAGRDGRAAELDGVETRRVHGHGMAGVDTALTPWPGMGVQADRIQQLLDSTLASTLEVCTSTEGFEIALTLENVAAGHAWPSGAAQDRRAWVELVATLGGEELLATGKVGADQAVRETLDNDANAWVLGDRIFDDAGREVHMFWDAREVTRSSLPAPTAVSPFDADYIETHIRRTWQLAQRPDRVEVRVWLRAMGKEVLDDLVASGDLSPEVWQNVRTWELGGAHKVWTAEAATDCAAAGP